MNGGMIKTTIREIKGSFGRYMAIMAIVMLGVAFFTGLNATKPAMIATERDYLAKQDFFDFKMLSTMGFDLGSAEKLAATGGIADAEGAISVDALCVFGAGNESVYKFHTVPERINRVVLTAGRMPERPDECLLDSAIYGEEALGTQLVVTDNNDEDTLEMFKSRTFTAVGVVRSPYYINFERGTTSIGTGTITGFLFVPKEAFDCDYLTEIYATAKERYEIYTDAYTDYIDGLQETVEEENRKLIETRYDRIVGEAQEKIDDAQTELNDKKAEAEEELADGWQKILDGGEELADGEKEIADARRKIADGKREIADHEQEMIDGEQEIIDGEKEIADGEQELADGEKEIADSEQEIIDGEKEIADGEKEIADNEKKIADGEKEIADAEKKIADGERELAEKAQEIAEAEEEINYNEWKLLVAGQELRAARRQLDEGAKELAAKEGELLAKEEELRQGEQYLNQKEQEVLAGIDQTKQGIEAVAAVGGNDQDLQKELAGLQMTLGGIQYQKQALEEGKPQLADGKSQIEAAKREIASYNWRLGGGEMEIANGERQLADAKEKLADGKAKFEDGRKELEDGKKELEDAKQELEDGKKELEDGKKKLEDAKIELEDGKKKLEDAKIELADGKIELADAKAELADGRQKLEDGRAELEKAKTDLAKAEKDLAKGKVDLEEGKIKLADAETEYADAKAEFEEEVGDAQQKIDDARAELADIEKPEDYVLTREANVGYVCYESDSNIVAAIAYVFPLFFFLVAALVCMTTMNRMVEEQRTQIGVLKALGYGNGSIMGKYLFYSGSAAAIGTVAGCFVGTWLFPKVIWMGYGIMYSMGDIRYFFDPWIALLSLAAALLCSMGTAYFSCRHELYSAPADLIRPKAPRGGKRVFLERIPFLWKRMKFLHKVSVRNLVRYKKRFFMMILGISGCTALLVTGFGIKDSVVNVADLQYDEIQTNDIEITLSDKAGASAQEEVEAQMAGELQQIAWRHAESVELDFGGKVKSVFLEIPEDVAAMEAFLHLHTQDGAQIAYPGPGEAVLTWKMAETLGIQAGDEVTLWDADRNALTVTVTALCENYVSNYIYVNRETYAAQMGREPEYRNAYAFTKEGADVHETAAAVSDLDDVLSVSVTADMRGRIKGMMENMDYIVLLVIVNAGSLAFVVLYNLTNINITERIREIATIKVLGFYAKETADYVFRENLALTAMGAFVGLWLGKWLHWFVMYNVRIDMVSFKTLIAPASYGFSLFFTFAFALSVNGLMYFKLEKVNMAESLKSVE